MNGANCALCDATWPVGFALSFSMPISGAARPAEVLGPGWSEPEHEQAEQRCPESQLRSKLYLGREASECRAAAGLEPSA